VLEDASRPPQEGRGRHGLHDLAVSISDKETHRSDQTAGNGQKQRKKGSKEKWPVTVAAAGTEIP
jgi:hypothetical protein